MRTRKPKDTGDQKLILRFIARCSREHLTLEMAGKRVGRSKGWASLIVNGKIKRLKFQTKNLILDFLRQGETHDTPHGAGDGEPAQDKP